MVEIRKVVNGSITYGDRSCVERCSGVYGVFVDGKQIAEIQNRRDGYMETACWKIHTAHPVNGYYVKGIRGLANGFPTLKLAKAAATERWSCSA